MLRRPTWGPIAVRLFALGIAVATSAVVHGQKAASAVTEASIRAHMEMLASDALDGRGSGTRDEWIAATYIASNLRRWGIEPLGDAGGYVQDVTTTRGDFARPPVVSAGGLSLVHGRQMLVQSMGTAHASGPLVKYVKDAAIPRGSVVLVVSAAAPEAGAIAGAAAVLTLETDAMRRNRASLAALVRAAPSATRPWRIALDGPSYVALTQLDEGTVVKVDAEVTPGHTWNVIGRLRGSDARLADDVILLSAHLDHLGVRGTGPDRINNGADDDASGTTAVLELAETIARGRRPKRTVMFAWFGSEEAGGFGARHFLDEPPVPLDRIVLNLEFEMIGRPDDKVPPHTLWLTGYERSNLGEELARRGARIVADPHPEQNFFTRSDNIQLAYRGIVAQTVSSFGLHKQYHTPADDLEHIDFAHMTEAIRSMVAPVLWLANSTFRPDWRPGGRPVPRAGRGGGVIPAPVF